MDKSLVINFKILKELSISPEELLYLHSIYNKDETSITVDLLKLQEKQFIKIITENEKTTIILRTKSIKLLEFLYVETDDSLEEETIVMKKSQRIINSEISDRVDEFRIKWQGLKPGSMGSVHSCKAKLTRWVKENPNYTFDEILKAADLYIESLHGDYRYLQRADYFIYKQENNREESSRLSAYIEELKITKNDDWTTNLN